MLHDLKCWPAMFELVRTGRKTFEVRKDDRSYSENDELLLREWSPEGGYTGRELFAAVTLVVRGAPLPDGICAMQIWVAELSTPVADRSSDAEGGA